MNINMNIDMNIWIFGYLGTYREDVEVMLK